MEQSDRVTLADAAKELGISWHRAWRLALTGELDSHRESGRWYVSRESVESIAVRMRSER